MSLMTLGITRGLIGQLLGTIGGMALIVVVRLVWGYEQVWYAEGAWSLGAIGGIIGFMVGVGTLDDWYAWVMGKETPLRHGPPPGQPAWTRYFGVDYNHKVIGIQYGVTGLLMLVIGGSFALIFRTELTRTGLQFLAPDTFNTMISMHGWAALMGILIAIGGMSNYLVPLMLGAEDMAFPRLNAFGFWINIPAIVLLLGSVHFGWDGGWTVYPPLSTIGSVGFQLVFYAIFALGLSSIVGSLNLIATIIRMRPQGMSLFRMPIFCWSVLATSLIQLTGTQLIALAFLMLSVQRSLGMGFFDPAKGGQPILFQHLFWFYSHPAVYVFVLPGLGIISEILPVFTRKPLFGYRWVALSSLAIAGVGFLAWGHHMFVSGYAPYLRVVFMISTMLIAIPTGVKFFSWVGTMWGGKLTFPTPMLFVLGAISIFLIGGLSGPILATAASDIFLHDTYFVVGHFHATIFGGFMFPFFAAIYFWYPKITGRMYNEQLGKIHFWIMTPAFWIQSIGQMSVGAMGMRRRIADYDPQLHVDTGHVLITFAGFAIALSVLLMIYNLLYSREVGVPSGDNPWRARSAEWQIPSPVPEHSFARPLRVIGEPYDYGLSDGGYVRMLPDPIGDD